MSTPRILLFRIEPAGYMLALARALREIWPGEVDVVFMSRGLSQKWDLPGAEFTHDVLPAGRVVAMRAMRARIENTSPALLHVAGWSAPPSLTAIVCGHARGVPVVVDSDTWRGKPSVWRGWVKRRLYPQLFKCVTHFAPGGARQVEYLRSFGVPGDKITPIHMTVDVTAIRRFLTGKPDAGTRFREKIGVVRDATVALYVGRLVLQLCIEFGYD